MTLFYRIIFNLFALSMIIVLGVDLFYAVVQERLGTGHTTRIAMPFAPEAKSPQKPPLKDYRVIVERNVFGASEKKEEVVTREIETLEPTSLNVVLLGTVAGDSRSAVAVIRDPAKKSQDFYRVGDAVQGAVLKRILRGEVIVRVGGRDEILRMEDTAGPGKEKGAPAPEMPERMGTVTVDGAEVKDALQSINKLLAQARIRPHFREGKADGLTLSNIKGDSVFSKMGLLNGDIIQGIDGSPVRRPNDVLVLYRKLKSGAQFSLDLTRKGVPNKIDVQFR